MSADQLVWAVKNGDMEQVKKQVKELNPKINLNSEINGGRAALHFAADYGQTDVIEYLLNEGADINLPDKHGITPLLAAVFEGHIDAVKLLLKKGANKDGKAPDGRTYLESAETDDIKLLLK